MAQCDDNDLKDMALSDLRCGMTRSLKMIPITCHNDSCCCRAAQRDLESILEEAKLALVPPDTADEGSAIVEIRAGHHQSILVCSGC